MSARLYRNKPKNILKKTRRRRKIDGGERLVTDPDPKYGQNIYYLGLDWTYIEMVHDSIMKVDEIDALLKHTSYTKDLTSVLMGDVDDAKLKERGFYDENSLLRHHQVNPIHDPKHKNFYTDPNLQMRYLVDYDRNPNNRGDSTFRENYFRMKEGKCDFTNYTVGINPQTAQMYIGCFKDISDIDDSSRFILSNASSTGKPPRMSVNFLNTPILYDKTKIPKELKDSTTYTLEDTLIYINNTQFPDNYIKRNGPKTSSSAKKNAKVKHVFITLDATTEPVKALLHASDSQFPHAKNFDYIWIINVILTPPMYADPSKTGNKGHLPWYGPYFKPRSVFVGIRVFRDTEQYTIQENDPISMYTDSITFTPNDTNKQRIETTYKVSNSGLFKEWTIPKTPGNYTYNTSTIRGITPDGQEAPLEKFINAYSSHPFLSTGFTSPIEIKFHNDGIKKTAKNNPINDKKFLLTDKDSVRTLVNTIISNHLVKSKPRPPKTREGFNESNVKSEMFMAQLKRIGDHGQISYNRNIGKRISEEPNTMASSSITNRIHYEWGAFNASSIIDVSLLMPTVAEHQDRTNYKASLRQMLIEEGVNESDIKTYVSSRFVHSSGDYPAFGYSLYHGMTTVICPPPGGGKDDDDNERVCILGIVNASVRTYK
jgi:hypothetical protein